MAGISKTTRYELACLCSYLYSVDVILRIEKIGRDTTYTLDVPEMDLVEIESTFDKGECSLSDARSFMRCTSSVGNILNQLKRSGQTSWESRSWVEGRG